jgi:hypothetical protein
LELAAFRPEKTKGRVAMLMFALYFPGLLAISLLQDSIGIEFGDQGRKLLGGFAVAVVVAIAVTVIRFRRRDKNSTPAFISITSCREEDPPAKPAHD